MLGEWIWLYPLGYGAHLADEAWFGGGLPAWITTVSGTMVPAERYATLSAALFAGLLVLLVLARWGQPRLMVVLAALVSVNAALHVVISIAVRAVSPGLLTAVIVWLPLGGGTLRWGERRFGRRTVVASVGLALGIQVGIAGLLLW